MKFKVFRYKKVKSTNLTAIRIIKNSNLDYGMVISKTQTNGKGQYGKKWISYEGNLLVSFFYKIDSLRNSLKQLTMFNCLIVKNLISKYYKRKIIYKKPNDLLVNRRKICGILQETVGKLDKKYLIVGIGINLKKNPNIKNYPTENLFNLINKNISKKKFENELKTMFESKLTKLYKLN